MLYSGSSQKVGFLWSGFCGQVMLGSSRVRGLHLHGSLLDIIFYVVTYCLDDGLVFFVV